MYGDIREKYGRLEDYEDLVNFFQEVLERREELESQDSRVLDGQNTLLVGTNTRYDASTEDDAGTEETS